MIAIVGIPGSTHHAWARFASRADADAWLNTESQSIREQNPAVGSLPTEIVSDREASRRCWADGSRIYTESLDGGR